MAAAATTKANSNTNNSSNNEYNKKHYDNISISLLYSGQLHKHGSNTQLLSVSDSLHRTIVSGSAADHLAPHMHTQKLLKRPLISFPPAGRTGGRIVDGPPLPAAALGGAAPTLAPTLGGDIAGLTAAVVVRVGRLFDAQAGGDTVVAATGRFTPETGVIAVPPVLGGRAVTKAGLGVVVVETIFGVSAAFGVIAGRIPPNFAA
jgi:hypothetical protein